MEKIPPENMIKLRTGLLGLRGKPEEELLAAGPREHAAVYDFLDFLDGVNASPVGLWRYLGICYLAAHSCLAKAEKESPANPKSAGLAEDARLEMAELRRIADVIVRSGVENPEGISPDVIDRDGMDEKDLSFDDLPETGHEARDF